MGCRARAPIHSRDLKNFTRVSLGAVRLVCRIMFCPALTAFDFPKKRKMRYAFSRGAMLGNLEIAFVHMARFNYERLS